MLLVLVALVLEYRVRSRTGNRMTAEHVSGSRADERPAQLAVMLRPRAVDNRRRC